MKYFIKMIFVVKDLVDFAVYFDTHVKELLENNLGLTQSLMDSFFKFNGEIMRNIIRNIYKLS